MAPNPDPPPFDPGEPLKPVQPAPAPLPEGVTTLSSFASGIRAEWAKSTPEEDAEHERYVQRRKAELEAIARAKALKDWQQACPPRLQTTDWAYPAIQPHMDKIRRILAWKKGPTGIAAFGRSGRGKSRALWALVRRLAVDELVPVKYLTQGDVMSDINRDGLGAWLEKLDLLKRVPVISYDDFGNFAAITSRRDLLATELFDLIDYRFHHNLPILLTSNSREADLASIFGQTRAEPLFRRIYEGNEVIDFDKAPTK